jgi:hypothetical protein
MREVTFLLETLICGNEKVSVLFNIPKVVVANTMKFCFYNGGNICVRHARFL